ncbi:MAG TPA: hypothetical protein VJH20_03825 [Candidatus Nanoarchaeia archaeon]|nr:hypothetical protein [Candidatus Nanoarchaeia archaeon]
MKEENKEKILLKIFKEIDKTYNANSLSKELDLTSRGILKILKSLKKENLLISKKMGKSTFYKINLQDLYARKTLEALLVKEANKQTGRWVEEFKPILQESEAVIIFGSIIRNPEKANDIDILLIIKKDQYKKVSSLINEKNKVLTKKIHGIIMTLEDLKENIKNNPAIKDSIKTGYVLHGHEKIVEVIKDVSSF